MAGNKRARVPSNTEDNKFEKGFRAMSKKKKTILAACIAAVLVVGGGSPHG